MTETRSSSVDVLLAGIEKRVLEDMWIGRGRVVLISTLTAFLTVSLIAWWLSIRDGGPTPGANRGASVVISILVAPILASATALITRRFRYCCAAAYAGGLSAVLGIGAFWWHRTGAAQSTPWWLALADLSVVLLTVAWLSVVATPMTRSQPDMRAQHLTNRR